MSASRGARRQGGRAAAATDRALVLRRFPYGESSLVVHVLTRTRGRRSLLAKGAYRPRSGYCGVLDLFDTLELTWRSQKRSDVGVLSAGSVLVRRRGLTASLELYRAGLTVLELAGLGAREADPDPVLHDLTEETLDLLDAGQGDPSIAVTAYDLRFLACMGLAPALVTCAACGDDLEGGKKPVRGGRSVPLVPFSRGAGGRLCDPCAAEARASGRRVESLSLGVLRIAHRLLEAPTASLARIRVDPSVSGELRSFTAGFLEYHLETRPRTRRREGARRGARRRHLPTP